jgi:Holliday junction resolvase RusA-like endonuclease
MAKTNFSAKWLEEKGLVKNADGTYSKQKPVSEKPREFVISHVKEKVNNSPDFEHKVVTEWFIPYQTPSKKNSRQTFPHPKTGKIINIPSKSYKEYVTATKKYWEVFGIEFRQTIKKLNIKYPINVEMTFIRKTNQIVDYFGPGESVFDLMTDFKWWEDDNRRYGKPFFGDMEVDKNNPGVKIKILL